MGTNFYATVNSCKHCDRSDTLHIGKSSAGWAFSLRVHEEHGLTSWDAWCEFLRRKAAEGDLVIVDEYGEQKSAEEFIDYVPRRIWQSADGSDLKYDTPMRHHIDRVNRVALCPYEFS